MPVFASLRREWPVEQLQKRQPIGDDFMEHRPLARMKKAGRGAAGLMCGVLATTRQSTPALPGSGLRPVVLPGMVRFATGHVLPVQARHYILILALARSHGAAGKAFPDECTDMYRLSEGLAFTGSAFDEIVKHDAGWPRRTEPGAGAGSQLPRFLFEGSLGTCSSAHRHMRSRLVWPRRYPPAESAPGRGGARTGHVGPSA